MRLLLLLSFLLVLPVPASADLIVLLHVPNTPGDSTVVGYEGWIEVTTMELTVDRELGESGEQGGTEDLNIGIGTLGVVKMAKALDRASALLFQFAINGNSPGSARIRFLDTSTTTTTGAPRVYLAYKLDRSFVKSMKVVSNPGEIPLEVVEWYYNRIASVYYRYDQSGNFADSHLMSWDNVTNTTWALHGISLTPPQDGSQ